MKERFFSVETGSIFVRPLKLSPKELPISPRRGKRRDSSDLFPYGTISFSTASGKSAAAGSSTGKRARRGHWPFFEMFG
jgi:hypothetical protein